MRHAGSSTIKALGAEVDRLEAAIFRLVPGIRHIDLVLTLLPECLLAYVAAACACHCWQLISHCAKHVH